MYKKTVEMVYDRLKDVPADSNAALTVGSTARAHERVEHDMMRYGYGEQERQRIFAEVQGKLAADANRSETAKKLELKVLLISIVLLMVIVAIDTCALICYFMS